MAPSGSGKTATVIDLAARHFVTYSVCSIASPTISPGFTDPNFIVLAEDIESMYRAVIQKNQGGWQDAVDTDSEIKALAGERVKIEFLARLFFLLSLLNNDPVLEPRHCFREQTSERGASTIRKWLTLSGITIPVQLMLCLGWSNSVSRLIFFLGSLDLLLLWMRHRWQQTIFWLTNLSLLPPWLRTGACFLMTKTRSNQSTVGAFLQHYLRHSAICKLHW